MITAEQIAEEIAVRLQIRDDIARASVDQEDPTLVMVTTQGGKTYLVYVESASESQVST